MKICSKCKQFKLLSEFHKDKYKSSGYISKCKECLKSSKVLLKLQLLKQNKKYCPKCNKVKDLSKFYKFTSLRIDNTCKICRNKSNSKHRKENKEYYKKYNLTHKINLKISQKKYYLKTKTKWNKYARNWKKIQRENNLEYKLLEILRSRLRSALLSNSKSKRTLELLGCTVPKLKLHLENQFKPGMTWQNHKFYGWHIDHIKPCASFDLSDPEQQKLCFHYTNLQPLWRHENQSKGSKIL